MVLNGKNCIKVENVYFGVKECISFLEEIFGQEFVCGEKLLLWGMHKKIMEKQPVKLYTYNEIGTIYYTFIYS